MDRSRPRRRGRRFLKPDWSADEPGVSRVVRATLRCNAAVPDRAGDPPQQVDEVGRNTCLQYRVSFNEHHISEGWQPFWEQYRHPMMEEIVRRPAARPVPRPGATRCACTATSGQRDYLLLGRVFLEETERRDLEVGRCPSWVQAGRGVRDRAVGPSHAARGARAAPGRPACAHRAARGAGCRRLPAQGARRAAPGRCQAPLLRRRGEQRGGHRAGGGRRGGGVSDAGGHGDLRAAVAPAGVPGALPAAAGGDRPRQLLRVPQGAGRGARRFPGPAVPQAGHPLHDGARGAAALDHRGQARREGRSSPAGCSPSSTARCSATRSPR